MSNTVDNYLFLGLPKSGKTTYFSIMAQRLQDVANREKNMKFLYLPTPITDKESEEDKQEERTSDFIADCISRFKKAKWPKKTQAYEDGYTFELTKYFSLFGKPILQKYFYKKAVIKYHDYPGEAFEVAFGVIDSPTPEIKKAADDMKEKIASASGLFLILDADSLFCGTDSKKQRITLTKLFQCIKSSKPDIKLAIIFNKLELFCGHIPNLERMLRNDYSNAYAYLPDNHKFFYVYPLGTVGTGDDGWTYPPKTLSPKNILAPVKWMIGF